jgi:hypothetical protein
MPRSSAKRRRATPHLLPRPADSPVRTCSDRAASAESGDSHPRAMVSVPARPAGRGRTPILLARASARPAKCNDQTSLCLHSAFNLHDVHKYVFSKAPLGLTRNLCVLRLLIYVSSADEIIEESPGNDCYGFPNRGLYPILNISSAISTINRSFQVIFVMNPACTNPRDIVTCEFHQRRLGMIEQLSFIRDKVPITFHGLHHSSHKVIPGLPSGCMTNLNMMSF